MLQLTGIGFCVGLPRVTYCVSAISPGHSVPGNKPKACCALSKSIHQHLIKTVRCSHAHLQARLWEVGAGGFAGCQPCSRFSERPCGAGHLPVSSGVCAHECMDKHAYTAHVHTKQSNKKQECMCNGKASSYACNGAWSMHSLHSELGKRAPHCAQCGGAHMHTH